MGKTKNIYQSNQSKILESIQKDLEAKKITEEEFGMLIGLLFKVEINNFIKHKVKQLDIEDDRKLTYIGYERTRKFSPAI